MSDGQEKRREYVKNAMIEWGFVLPKAKEGMNAFREAIQDGYLGRNTCSRSGYFFIKYMTEGQSYHRGPILCPLGYSA